MPKKTKTQDLSSTPGHVSIRARGRSGLVFTVKHLAQEGLLPKKYITEYMNLSEQQARTLINSLKTVTTDTVEEPENT